MARRIRLATKALVLSFLVAAAGASPARADRGLATQTESFFPASTFAFLAVPNVESLCEAWQKTRLGILFREPMMEPFAEELRRWSEQELSQLDRRLGLQWRDLDEVQGGELAIGLSPLDNNKNAIGFMMDVSAKRAEAERLLRRVDHELTSQKVKSRELTLRDARVVEYTFPPRRERLLIHKAYYTIHRNWLVVSDHASMLEHLLRRLDGEEGACLGEAPTYAAIMDRCATASGDAPHVRWYVQPFALARAIRETSTARKTRYTEAFERQGFDVIRGVGGWVCLGGDQRDASHYTFIYAPGPGDGQDRFRLAARMLDFPNQGGFEPPAWIPEDAASVLSLNWRMKEAFDFASTLVNEIADDDVFEDVLASVREDENGPQIDIRREVVEHLTDQAWMVTWIQRPIDVKSEWKVLAVGVRNPTAVGDALERALKNDPYARRLPAHPEIWEIFDKPSAETAGGFGFGADGRKPDERLIKNGAVAVMFDHLMFATDPQFLERIKLGGGASHSTVRDQRAFQRVMQAMSRLDAGAFAGRFLVRHQLIQEAHYELARQGKLPEARTTLGRIVNWIAGPSEKELRREQRVDGSLLPEFSQIVDYLGVGGMAARSEIDGWMIWGCILPP